MKWALKFKCGVALPLSQKEIDFINETARIREVALIVKHNKECHNTKTPVNLDDVICREPDYIEL